MADMTKQTKHNLLLSIVAVGGVLVLAVLCRIHRCETDSYSIATLTEKEEAQQFTLEFDYNLGSPSPYIRIAGGASFDPRTRLIGEAPAHVRIFPDDGKLRAKLLLPPKSALPAGVHVRGNVQQSEVIYRRRPDGLRHPLHLLLLTFEFYHTDEIKPSAVILQQIELDMLAKTADYVPNISQGLPARYEGLEFTDYGTTHRGELPGKIDAPPVPAAILRMVYALAAVETKEQAEGTAHALQQYAEQIIYHETAPGADWPDNWGDSAAYVREASQLLAPTLTYLKEHEYFRSTALANFVHSSLFEIIFGEQPQTHHDTPPERKDEESNDRTVTHRAAH